jgi:hypothetical protein
MPHGGARIILMAKPDSVPDVDSWIRFNTSGTGTISRVPVILRRASSGADLRTAEVTFGWADGKKQYETVDCYFEISGHLFYSRLTYWKGDSKASGYRQVQHAVVQRIVVGEKQRR